MPTLEWIGKNKVVNHHQEVPFRVLERQYSFDEQGQHTADNGSENMIIHGDNLEALKALLPQYEGKVKCIYIDPPYNTGNEGWCYNDNVSDPHIQKWLGEVVGKEGEDLTRHDKWLCMMYPRLMLLQKLLADDGVIFISIDDNELYNLKSVCDEIFGASCYVSDIAWQRTYSTRNDSKGIVNEVEHILVYSKEPEWNPNKLPRTAEMDAKYKNPDNDVSAWRTSDAFAPGAATHQGMVYAIQHPFTGKMLYPSNGACWRYQQDTMLEIMNGWTKYELQNLHDEKERAHVCGISPDEVRPDVKAIVLADPLEVASANAQKVLERGQWPRFFFTKGGKGGIARKTYLENVGGRLPTNFWPFSETGHTDEAKKEMLAMNQNQLDALEQMPVNFANKICDYIIKLQEETARENFYNWLEVGKIVTEPRFKLTSHITLSGKASSLTKSLYKQECELDDNFEYDMAMALTGIDSVRWWHRNPTSGRNAFCLNAFRNHYPDFIVMTNSGKVLLVETKGDQLENAESREKIKLGRAWQNAAGSQYRYYMVFQSKDLHLEGAYRFDEFLKILGEL